MSKLTARHHRPVGRLAVMQINAGSQSLIPEMLGQPLGKIYRPMLPAGAAKGNADVAKTTLQISAHRTLGQITNIIPEPLHFLLALQKFDHRLILPG